MKEETCSKQGVRWHTLLPYVLGSALKIHTKTASTSLDPK